MKPTPDLPDSVDYSPEKLLAPFTRGQIVLWMAVALGLHVLLIGGTSLGYIRDRWLDPDGAAIRKSQAESVAAAAAAAVKKSEPPKVTPPPVAPPPKPVETSLAEHKDTPVVKRITAAAPTNAVPKSPDEIGISLRDTDVK